MEIAVLFGSFFILLLLSVPVGHAIGISGLLSFLICTDYSPMVFIKSSLSGTDSFTLLAVPFLCSPEISWLQGESQRGL